MNQLKLTAALFALATPFAAQAQETTIYYVEPFLGEAQIVATDLGYELGDVPILPASEAPPVSKTVVASGVAPGTTSTAVVLSKLRGLSCTREEFT